LQEDYVEGQGGKRLVQYFDKSRMEINNPNADPSNRFFVTNGLLAVELISGRMQTGNNTFVNRYPADIPMASDPDDANAPTYLSFQGVSNTQAGDHPANSRVGLPATSTISRSGTIGDDPTKATYPKVNIVYFEPATKHNVPLAIWEFLNQTGPVYNSATGLTTTAQLSDPWSYATGLPISEAYWARVKVAGQLQDVLIQAFERRIVTYMPNGVPGFKVQVGNIGQHYYDWRYKDAGRPATQPTPQPGTTPPATTPTRPPSPPTPTAVPPTAAPDCSGIPPGQNMTVTPNCGPGGTVFRFQGRNFKPGELVTGYITLPDQSVCGPPDCAPPEDFAANSGGMIDIRFGTDPDYPTGFWAITFEGLETHNKAIGYFKLTGTTSTQPTPTTNPNATTCNDVPASQNTVVRPSNCEKAGTEFSFLGSGFQPGETVSGYITLPDQSVCGPPNCAPREGFQAGADGTLALRFPTRSNYPLGIWALTMEGISSRKIAIGYFKLLP
jgi:hypothetical protein